MKLIRKLIVAGLLVWIPLVVTYAVVVFMVDVFDDFLTYLPEQWHPTSLIGFKIPGLGLIVFGISILVTGVLITNFVGEYFMKIMESIMRKVPIVNTIYTSVKQLSQSVLGDNSNTFQQAYLIQYPRNGLWTIAFKTNDKLSEAHLKIDSQDVVSLYVPTTPNPTSGFFIMAKKSEIYPLQMKPDVALKMIISTGVVIPDLEVNKFNNKTED